MNAAHIVRRLCPRYPRLYNTWCLWSEYHLEQGHSSYLQRGWPWHNTSDIPNTAMHTFCNLDDWCLEWICAVYRSALWKWPPALKWRPKGSPSLSGRYYSRSFQTTWSSPYWPRHNDRWMQDETNDTERIPSNVGSLASQYHLPYPCTLSIHSLTYSRSARWTPIYSMLDSSPCSSSACQQTQSRKHEECFGFLRGWICWHDASRCRHIFYAPRPIDFHYHPKENRGTWFAIPVLM